ncbi:hypothetical protein FHX62_004239, partial [Cupriavidus alkaliphilus]|nr:hypothetical protein [Cupriavidus alkaliphilus]
NELSRKLASTGKQHNGGRDNYLDTHRSAKK